VIRAAEAHIDTDEGRSPTDEVIELMDHVRSAIALLRACDPTIGRNRVSADGWEVRTEGSWAPIDEVTLVHAQRAPEKV
jgi:hypothetical protein